MLIKNDKPINQNLNLSQIIKSENGTHCKYQVQKIAQEIPNEFPLHVSYNFLYSGLLSLVIYWHNF